MFNSVFSYTNSCWQSKIVEILLSQQHHCIPRAAPNQTHSSEFPQVQNWALDTFLTGVRVSTTFCFCRTHHGTQTPCNDTQSTCSGAIIGDQTLVSRVGERDRVFFFFFFFAGDPSSSDPCLTSSLPNISSSRTDMAILKSEFASPQRRVSFGF